MHTSFRPASPWEAEFCAKARRLQGPADARRRRSPPPKPGGNSSLSRHGRCTPCAPAARATHPGALRQVVATQSVVQVEADHVAGGQGEVLSHSCARSTSEPLDPERRRRARVQNAAGLQGRTRRGGAGLRPPPGRRTAAPRASRARQPLPRPRFCPPLAADLPRAPPGRFPAWLSADTPRSAPASLSPP